MVFQYGIFVSQNSKISVTNFILNLGGYINVPLAIYSLRISFCTVPFNFEILISLSSATTISKANKMIAVEFIVIEIDTLSSGISCNKILISSIVEIGTPTLPTSPTDNS